MYKINLYNCNLRLLNYCELNRAHFHVFSILVSPLNKDIIIIAISLIISHHFTSVPNVLHAVNFIGRKE